MNAEQLLDHIKRSTKGWKPGVEIDLRACHAAQGGDNSIAQRLANLAKSPVYATPDLVTTFLYWETGPAHRYRLGKYEFDIWWTGKYQYLYPK